MSGKTKKQLRAEAVERLMHAELRAGVFFQVIVTALVGKGGGAMGTVERVRDLLTDDEPSIVCIDGDLPVFPVVGEKPKEVVENQGEADTREKVEADARAFAEYWAYDDYASDEVLDDMRGDCLDELNALLDRKAAITRRECAERNAKLDELNCTACRAAQKRKLTELQAKVDELEALREEACKICSDRLVDDLTGQVHELQSKVDDLTDQKRTLVAYVEADGTKYREEPDGTQVFDHSETRGVMPDGVEWPRFEDGATVKIGDAFMDTERCERQVDFVSFAMFGNSVAYQLHERDCVHAIGVRVERPPLTAKDGQPIEVGQVLYGEDGKAWKVMRIERGESHPVIATEPEFTVAVTRGLKPEWLTHKRPDSFERIAEELRIFASWMYEASRKDRANELADRIEKLAKEGA